MTLCACGCGEEISYKSWHKYRMPIYINGHNTPWNKNKSGVYSKEMLEKMSISAKKRYNPNKNPSNTIEARTKISNFHKNKPKSDEHRKKLSESKLNSNLCKKENHYNWKGGISKQRYMNIFNNILKEQIRKRDNYQCQIPECLITQLESMIIVHRKLSVHHIDYDKNNCNEYNLITLCHKHNSIVNFNRSFWQNFFTGVRQ